MRRRAAAPAASTSSPEATIAGAAAFLADDLERRSLPYWASTRDRRHGGFLLADSESAWPRVAERARWHLRRVLGRTWGATRPSPDEKHLVGQSRVVIALSLGHRLGFDPSGDALAAASAGVDFLLDHLADRRHGGFAWSADRRGRVVRPEKLLYGQAFALLALTELGRATGRRDLLDAALGHFRLFHERLRDRDRGGWREHATADFQPLPAGPVHGLIDRPACKSANAHLHVLEALTELVAATGGDDARAALEEAVAACAHFFPPDRTASRSILAADWSPLAGSVPPSVGHVLEHAWLLVRAHEVLGRPAPPEALLGAADRCLEDFDWDRGGFLDRDDRAGGSRRGRKEWWVQAEAVVALVAAVRLGRRPEHLRALALLLEWILRCQRRGDGVWVAATDREGRVINPTRAGSWKAGYHEVRACALLARAFRPAPPAGGAAPFD